MNSSTSLRRFGFFNGFHLKLGALVWTALVISSTSSFQKREHRSGDDGQAAGHHGDPVSVPRRVLKRDGFLTFFKETFLAPTTPATPHVTIRLDLPDVLGRLWPVLNLHIKYLSAHNQTELAHNTGFKLGSRHIFRYGRSVSWNGTLAEKEDRADVMATSGVIV